MTLPEVSPKFPKLNQWYIRYRCLLCVFTSRNIVQHIKSPFKITKGLHALQLYCPCNNTGTSVAASALLQVYILLIQIKVIIRSISDKAIYIRRRDNFHHMSFCSFVKNQTGCTVLARVQSLKIRRFLSIAKDFESF